ncbi:MAG TPA: hypothetical protein VN692_17700 [Steroidobacteraceae bacterium]|nr:hypothetical protein [Steroidobacteraceae bacterium]
MSDTIIEEKPDDKDAVSVDDLKRMLEESRGRLTSLERERDEERATRLVAEQERDTAAGRAVSETEQRWIAQKQAVEGTIAAAEAEADRAEREYAAAAESGDWAAAAKAQRALAGAESRAIQSRSQKDFLEQNKARLTQAPEMPRSQSSADKYGAVVKDLRPSEREWLDQRPQFMSDTRYRARVFGASQIADGEGHARGSPEYFRRIEDLLGEGQQETREAPRAQERALSADVAPQRRAAPGAAASGGREIRLTADQVEVADGLYGNPASPDYIADPGERYRKYHGNLERMRATGRL